MDRSNWWKTALGTSFFELEKKVVAQLSRHLFGYHALLLGDPLFLSMFEESPINHRVCLQPEIALIAEKGSALSARQDKLPIIADGVDLIYLAHCLEVIKNPHEVLREAYRTLVPEGHLLISCFNPWSLWGFFHWLLRWTNNAPWDGTFISTLRLKDWLHLLGFDVVSCSPFFFKPPINHAGTLQSLSGLEKWGYLCWPLGRAGYVILAKKRVITLTPMRPSFRVVTKPLTTEVIGVE
jgi:SAM-dependent methyltransferase